MVRRPERYGKLCHLPPLDAWKVNPDRIPRFHLPTDDRGFVLPRESIEVVLQLFEEDYEWQVEWSKNAPKIFAARRPPLLLV